MSEPTEDRIGAFWIWCFGVKVLMAFTLINLIASLPLYALAWMVCIFAGVDKVEQSTTAGVISLIAAIIWMPLAMGWMFHNARDWFELRLGRDD